MAGQAFISGELNARYAKALFGLADKAGALDAVGADLSALDSMIEGSADLAKFICSPLYSREDHVRGLGAILDKSGASPLTKQFVGTVAEQRRLVALTGMIESYQQMLAAKRGEMSAKVASAHPLSEAQVAAIKETLKAQLGSDVALETTVDESLLGGLVVRIGSRMIDSSLRTKLNRLQLNLKEAS